MQIDILLSHPEFTTTLHQSYKVCSYIYNDMHRESYLKNDRFLDFVNMN
jgi:hypothetical protein